MLHLLTLFGAYKLSQESDAVPLLFAKAFFAMIAVAYGSLSHRASADALPALFYTGKAESLPFSTGDFSFLQPWQAPKILPLLLAI